MDRVRRAGQFALFLVVALSVPAMARAIARHAGRRPSAIAAPVAWPTSTLLVSEVMTGGHRRRTSSPS